MGFTGGSPQPCQGLSLAAPCLQSHWECCRDVPVGMGWESLAGVGYTSHTSILLPVPALGQCELCRDGAACLTLATSPGATGWHQMKTNGLGDTLASIQGSAVLGSTGDARQHRQEPRQLPGWCAEHHSPSPLCSTPFAGSRGAALGFSHQHLGSAQSQSPPGAVSKGSRSVWAPRPIPSQLGISIAAEF